MKNVEVKFLRAVKERLRQYRISYQAMKGEL